MATQGIVTIRSDGKIVMKIVAGCNGYNAQKLADKLQKSWPVSIDEVYKIALDTGFGETTCLVVITDSNIKCEENDDEIHSRYREIFQQPEFNPRWKHGTADHVVIIDI